MAGALSQAELDTLVAQFAAPDPSLTRYCRSVMAWNGTTGEHSTSQAQGGYADLFVWRNLFSRLTARGEKAFYVDSGANQAVKGSNTFFFDRCLGWHGLCVEAGSRYQHELHKKRTCTIIPECLADREMSLEFWAAGAKGGLNSSAVAWNGHKVKPTRVPCNTLESMLARVPPRKRVGSPGGRPQVAFWSLDVEGFELRVLRAVPWAQLDVRAILVEDGAFDMREMDDVMNHAGFVKAHQMALDSLYVARAHASTLLPAGEFWYPPGFHTAVADMRSDQKRGTAYVPPVVL